MDGSMQASSKRNRHLADGYIPEGHDACAEILLFV
jgi:hypothetical protein